MVTLSDWRQSDNFATVLDPPQSVTYMIYHIILHLIGRPSENWTWRERQKGENYYLDLLASSLTWLAKHMMCSQRARRNLKSCQICQSMMKGEIQKRKRNWKVLSQVSFRWLESNIYIKLTEKDISQCMYTL